MEKSCWYALYALGCFKLATALIPDLALGLYWEALYDGALGLLMVLLARYVLKQMKGGE